MTDFPKKQEVWVTSDHRHHDNERVAIEHQRFLSMIEESNRMIEAGANLADVLDATGEGGWVSPEDRKVLAQVTRNTGLTIAHWQCRKEPGYSLDRRENDGLFFVGGYAGSWSGHYGARVSLRDIIRYARDTAAAHGGRVPPRWSATPPA